MLAKLTAENQLILPKSITQTIGRLNILRMNSRFRNCYKPILRMLYFISQDF